MGNYFGNEEKCTSVPYVPFHRILHSRECQLKYELLKGLKKIKDKISKEIYKRLESKLAQIDLPSNSERLEAPFDALGITLSEDESFLSIMSQ